MQTPTHPLSHLLRHSVTSCVLGPDIVPNTSFSKTSAAYVLPFMRDRVSHPNKETGSRNCVALIFIFIDCERALSCIIYCLIQYSSFNPEASTLEIFILTLRLPD